MVNFGRLKEVKLTMKVCREMFTLDETAKYLKIGKFTLYKMARDGRIHAVKKISIK
ncbi:MAG: helix-turn-helix domain-containing protein [Hydrogenothermaceae bacterium]